MTRNGAVLAGAAIVTGAAAALVLATAPEPGATGRVHADAALVLSGDVEYLRVKRAAALYGQGAVKALLLTGRGIGGDSADEMRKQAIAAGVPDAAIVLERDSTTTHENIVLAGPLIHARGWRRIALVTSRCHLPRALATARTALPDVQWVPVAVQDAGPPSRIRRMVLQELAKRLWYKARGWA